MPYIALVQLLMTIGGATGSQLGCGCECPTVTAFAPAVAPVVFAVREVPETRKPELVMERLEAERGSQQNPQ